MKSIQTALIAVLLVASVAVPAGTVAATDQQAETYSETHVSFESTESAIVDYSVDGQTVFESMTVQSQSTAQSQGGIGADISLSAVTSIGGSGLSLDSRSDVSATVTAESGAEMTAHDNSHGILVVSSDGESQYVTVNVSGSAEAESESDHRVVVTNADGTEGTFIVVGDGQVAVNERGNLSADLGSESTLVFRSYAGGGDDADREQERLIAEGTAAAEVYVTAASEGSSELTTDVVQYSEDTTVEVTERSEGTVTMTAERSQEEGRIVLTTVSEQAISSTEDLQVTVDGSAAAEASSYSELESAIDGGDSSRYMVAQQASAEADAEVLVAVNHFSTREVTMSEDGGDGTSDRSDDENGDSTSGNGPGFGVVAALVALLAAAALVASRRE